MQFSFARIALLHIIIIVSCAVAGNADTLQKAITIKLTSYYSQPHPGLLPRGYLKKGETHTIIDVTVDTVGIPWFSIVIQSKSVWSPAKYWNYVSEIDTAAYIEGKQGEEDKKRRLRILREHRDWPRRIIRIVRFGRICLDMTGEQLIASWDEPFLKRSAFTIGLGRHEIWFYKNQKELFTAVVVKNDKIIGWSN